MPFLPLKIILKIKQKRLDTLIGCRLIYQHHDATGVTELKKMAKQLTRSQLRKQKNQGMNWIRPAKRLAIYLRDGLACCYCGSSVEDGTKLTLDHITPLSRRGTNKETNLVTTCHRCNSSRGNRKVEVFAVAVAEYLNHGVQAEAILNFIHETVRRPLDVQAAKELIARRGGFTAALKGSN